MHHIPLTIHLSHEITGLNLWMFPPFRNMILNSFIIKDTQTTLSMVFHHTIKLTQSPYSSEDLAPSQ